MQSNVMFRILPANDLNVCIFFGPNLDS